MSNEEKNNGFNRVVITGMGAISLLQALVLMHGWSKVAIWRVLFYPSSRRKTRAAQRERCWSHP